MVFKEIKLKKNHFECPINLGESEERRPPEQLYSVALFALFVLVSLVLFTCASWGGALPVRLTPRDIDRMQSSYYDSLPVLENASQVVSCYYVMPAASDAAPPPLLPTAIRPHLCTHINVAFAHIQDKKILLEEHQRRTISDVVKLKEVNPDLKVLLTVGGAGSHSGFRDMVFNHTCRKTFIKSIKYILRNLSLDGIDLDWEFPALEYKTEPSKRERQHFSQLLREIRMEYRRERRDYLLTVAAAAPQIIVDAAYDVDQMDLYVDYVNIMTYDFNSYTRFTPLTGLNSPLYARRDDQLYPATLNINYTVQMYKSKGLRSSKIVVGIPTYGHSFTLVNSENTKVGSPALGFGSIGKLGFVNYPDICTFLNTFQNETTVQLDEDAKVPYLYRKSEWVSYDDPESVTEKAKYIRNNNLRGAMIYSLNADDYGGLCGLAGTEKFPLAVSIKNTLGGL